MNRKQKGLVNGFIEYLQGIYGEGGVDDRVGYGAPNSLLVPGIDAPDDPDWSAVALSDPQPGPIVGQMMQQASMAQPDPLAVGLGGALPPQRAPGPPDPFARVMG